MMMIIKEKYILFIRVAVAVTIITSLLMVSSNNSSTSSHIQVQVQAQPFESKYKNAVIGSGELGAGARLMENYYIAAKVSNTTSPELLNYAYNQGLAMGRQGGPNGIGDSANSAVCPPGVDLYGDYCKAMVRGYEDGFAQTCGTCMYVPIYIDIYICNVNVLSQNFKGLFQSQND